VPLNMIKFTCHTRVCAAQSRFADPSERKECTFSDTRTSSFRRDKV